MRTGFVAADFSAALPTLMPSDAAISRHVTPAAVFLFALPVSAQYRLASFEADVTPEGASGPNPAKARV